MVATYCSMLYTPIDIMLCYTDQIFGVLFVWSVVLCSIVVRDAGMSHLMCHELPVSTMFLILVHYCMVGIIQSTYNS